MRLMEFLESKKKFAENETNIRLGYCHLLAVAIRDDIESPRRPAIIFKKFTTSFDSSLIAGSKIF